MAEGQVSNNCQVCSIDTVLDAGCSSSPVSTNALVKMSVIEIPLDKELTVNCLAETHKKFVEHISWLR